MWQLLFSSLSARPRPRAHMRFMVGPPSIEQLLHEEHLLIKVLVLRQRIGGRGLDELFEYRAPLCGSTSSKAMASM